MQFKKIVLFLSAQLLLKSAVAVILLMKWLYNRRWISTASTSSFFHVAKWLEQKADGLSARRPR